MSEPIDPTGRVSLGGGEWLRVRHVPGVADKVLTTGPTGRALFLSESDLAAFAPREPGSAPRRRGKLDQLQLVHGPARTDEALAVGAVPHHVVFVSTMSEAIAKTTVERIFESEAAVLSVALRGAKTLEDDAVSRLLLAAASERSRALGRPLVASVLSTLEPWSDETRELVLDGAALLAFPFGGAPAAHDASRAVTGATSHAQLTRTIGDLHARFAARGVDAESAYLTGIVTLTPEVVAAGADALVSACAELGLAYFQLRLPSSGVAGVSSEERRDFEREVTRRVLGLNTEGTLLVERRLALHLEVLALAASRRPPRAAVEQLVYGPDGRVYAREVGPSLAAQGDARLALGDVGSSRLGELARRANARGVGAGCGPCVYDPHCGTSLLEGYLLDDDPEGKAPGGAYCRASMAAFDATFALLASPEGPTVRRVMARWMEARDRVSERIASSSAARV